MLLCIVFTIMSSRKKKINSLPNFGFGIVKRMFRKQAFQVNLTFYDEERSTYVLKEAFENVVNGEVSLGIRIKLRKELNLKAVHEKAKF